MGSLFSLWGPSYHLSIIYSCVTLPFDHSFPDIFHMHPPLKSEPNLAKRLRCYRCQVYSFTLNAMQSLPCAILYWLCLCLCYFFMWEYFCNKYFTVFTFVNFIGQLCTPHIKSQGWRVSCFWLMAEGQMARVEPQLANGSWQLAIHSWKFR